MVAVKDTSALKALADPTRIRMGLLLLEAPRTVKELAATLGVPPTRLYYHVRILEEHGLVEVADRRMVSGIEERRYRARPDNWNVGPELTGSALEESGVIGALFDAVKALVEVVIHDHPDEAIGEAGSAVAMLSMTELLLAPEETAALRERLGALMDEFSSERPDPPPDARRHHFLFAGYQPPGVPGAS